MIFANANELSLRKVARHTGSLLTLGCGLSRNMWKPTTTLSRSSHDTVVARGSICIVLGWMTHRLVSDTVEDLEHVMFHGTIFTMERRKLNQALCRSMRPNILVSEMIYRGTANSTITKVQQELLKEERRIRSMSA